MSAAVQNTTTPPNAPLPADLEPDEAWKDKLKQRIQDNLRHMFEDARKRTQEELEKAPPNEAERIKAAGEAAIQDIYKMAQEHYTIELQRERQERQWASGVWTEDMMKEQKAMWDNIERGKRHKVTGQDSEHVPSPPRPHSPQRPSPLSPQPPAPPSHPQPPPPPPQAIPTTKAHSPEVPPSRKPGRLARAPSLPLDNERSRGGASFSQPHSRDFDDVLPTVDEVHPLRSVKTRAGSITSASSYKAPSIFDGDRSSIDRPRPSPAHDDESISRPARSSTDPPDFTRRDSVRRKPSVVGRPNIPEIWKPSITPEEDAQMSRTFSLARRGSTASTTSSLRAPSILNASLTDEPQTVSSNVDREKAGIHVAEQEWGNLDRARDKEKQSHTHSESRPVLGAPQRLEERSGMHQPSSNIPNSSPASSIYSRPFDSSSRVHIPTPSASRPIVTKKSVSSFDDIGYGFSASPGAKGWSRSAFGSRNESSSRSPQTPDENPRNWQPSSLRAHISSQDMRNAYLQHEQLPMGSRPVHTHYEEDFEGQSDDEDVAWHHRGYHKYNLGQIKEIESLRIREEAARKWEEDLKRREEELEREKETKRIEEAKRKEDEAKQEDEARQREEEETRKATLARRKEEEAEAKKERAIWIEEAKRKEREVRMKELEIKRKEEEARKKEKEAERKEEEAKKIAEEAMKKEDEAQRRERQASLKEAEARRIEEQAQMKQAETLRKEAELKEWEAKVRRREEDVLRREAELARTKEEERQKAMNEEFRKREEEIRRRSEEKKKQDGWTTWSESQYPTPPLSQTSNPAGPLPMPSRNDRSAPAASPPNGPSTTPNRGSASGWTPAPARPSSTTSSQTSSAFKPTTGTTPSSKPTWNPPASEAEFHQRQAEQARQREEQFKREQARIAMQEYERVHNKSGREMTREEAVKIFEAHRRQWEKIQSRESLIWEDFPWPMFKTPSNPEDLTTVAIHGYMLSPFHPQDKSQRDRIKELIKRWHPDRFNHILSKVKASDLEKVSEGGGLVVRALNDLLRSSE